MVDWSIILPVILVSHAVMLSSHMHDYDSLVVNCGHTLLYQPTIDGIVGQHSGSGSSCRSHLSHNTFPVKHWTINYE